ncbi:MAG: N-acetyltransferase [Proteobacteria bacterium]|nr:N-acetyltransferase [Pseudomonadota bacterium]MDE2412284.1 N-acetyltransferase [Sphingomonadales bacterium]
MKIEPALPADVAEIAAIYGHHVIHGTATYELDPPDEADMAARLAKVSAAGWPWLVARDEASGAVMGYAYATQFRDRAAYRFACEDSIYIHPDWQGRGLGKILLTALLDACEAAGFRQIYAVIGGAEPASIALHAALGFEHCGALRGSGRKHGRWLDTAFMQRALGPGDTTPPPEEPH